MFEDDQDANGSPDERPFDPAQRAKEKADEFRMHAELFAVYEGPRKFDAAMLPSLDAQVTRDLQQRIARLEKSKSPESPILPDASVPDAAALLDLPASAGLSTNDYHVHRRPGEVMIARWLEGEQVEKFYGRMQAHVDAGLDGYREEERQSQGWKQDPKTLAYLDALDALELRAADRYLRDAIRQHNVFVLSTVTADEMDILHLADHIMGIPAAELVGPASAPPDEDPSEQDRAWFFKLFALRGKKGDAEQMLFFTYLQKAEDTFDLE